MTASTHYSRFATYQDGGVLVVRFHNPPHHFFDTRTSIELDRLTRKLKRDKSVGAVVFAGQDTAYTHLYVPDLLRGSQLLPFAVPYRLTCVMATLMRLSVRSRVVDRLLSRTPLRGVVLLFRTNAAIGRLSQLDAITIASINGNALALGCVFALACDIRLMADDDLVIGMPESAVGMLAGAGGTQRLVRTVGTTRAIELLMNCRLLTPTEAVDWGLIHRVVDPDNLLDEATETAHRMSRRSRVVNRELKRAIYDAGSQPMGAGLHRETASLIAVVTAEGSTESITPLNDALKNCDLNTGQTLRNAWTQMIQRETTS